VPGKGYDLTGPEGQAMWDQVVAAMGASCGPRPGMDTEIEQPSLFGGYGDPALVRRRLGQGTFQVLVTEAYRRSCAITGERALPALEAAHIRPFSELETHTVQNGLLLRSDVHRLFDRGYITVTPEHARRAEPEPRRGRGRAPGGRGAAAGRQFFRHPDDPGRIDGPRPRAQAEGGYRSARSTGFRRGTLMPTPRVIAVDWSGARTGAARKIWLAEVADGRLRRLESGRDREALTRLLIDEAEQNPDLIVGLDFAFSFLHWCLQERGLDSVRALWELATEEGENWLADCEPPFWGRPGRGRPDHEGLRRTDLDVKRRYSSQPKSPFQIGGAGAVGTMSIRGMPFLATLKDAGFNIWPFDPPRPPVVVEIYPRLLTGDLVKSDPAARALHIRGAYPEIGARHRQLATGSEAMTGRHRVASPGGRTTRWPGRADRCG
jgi:hypothetical protein